MNTPTKTTKTTRSPRRITIVAVAAASVTMALGAAAIPRPPSLSADTSGNESLITEVRQALDEQGGLRNHLSVAVIDGDTVRTANFGATQDSEYEIGSVTKTITGSLLAEAIDRGEVTDDTPLGDLLDLGDSPAASVTLRELATHSSGLPRLPVSFGSLVSTIVANYRASDPYGSTVSELEADARGATLDDAEFLYSNFGFALLGQALASAADSDTDTDTDSGYSTLATERILAPLGMDSSYVPTSADALRPDAPTGYTASGRPSDAWTLGADAPAGSARSTLTDMVAYVTAQRDRTAPGVSATDPDASAGDLGNIGYGWITTDDVTWHNGATGGFTSFVGFDRETDRAVVVLNNTASSVDDLGFALMEVD